ncbi:MAG: hypothetical protein HFE41_02360 [Clostridia bacterium]|jgi:hypothetical protein|nr:hypothetical protein [Clostridia bacterium]
MMDRISNAVIDKICSFATVGRYVIFSEDELYEAFPEGEKRDLSTLKNALKTLLNAGYIDIKYSGGSLYCIAPIKKYEPEPEQIILPEPELRLPEKAKRERKYLLPFLAAFSGGALGSLLVSLTFALI